MPNLLALTIFDKMADLWSNLNAGTKKSTGKGVDQSH